MGSNTLLGYRFDDPKTGCIVASVAPGTHVYVQFPYCVRDDVLFYVKIIESVYILKISGLKLHTGFCDSSKLLISEIA